MPTLQDVAADADVSISTVSRVLNHPEMVEPTTRARVRTSIDELGYRPNRAARRLGITEGRTHLLGVVIPDIENPFYSTIIRAVEEVAYSRDYAVILCNSGEDDERERFYLNVLQEESADGVILPPSTQGARMKSDLKELDLPVVCFDRRLPGDPFDTVVVDNKAGARQMTRHLLDLGHRRIGFLGGPASLSTSTERADGYREAVRTAGLPVDENLMVLGPPGRRTGRTHSQRLLQETSPPTALFAANNQIALGTFEGLRDLGVQVPDDVAVAGFDDAPWASFLDPPLTTVRQPTYEMGRRAAELLFSRIDDPDRPPVRATLQPECIIRASCGADR